MDTIDPKILLEIQKVRTEIETAKKDASEDATKKSIAARSSTLGILGSLGTVLGIAAALGIGFSINSVSDQIEKSSTAFVSKVEQLENRIFLAKSEIAESTANISNIREQSKNLTTIIQDKEELLDAVVAEAIEKISKKIQEDTQFLSETAIKQILEKMLAEGVPKVTANTIETDNIALQKIELRDENNAEVGAIFVRTSADQWKQNVSVLRITEIDTSDIEIYNTPNTSDNSFKVGSLFATPNGRGRIYIQAPGKLERWQEGF